MGGLHLIGVGEVADWVFASYVSFKGGYAFGSDLVQCVNAVWGAHDEKDLRIAATYFARAVSQAGLNTIVLLASRKIGKNAQMDAPLEREVSEEHMEVRSGSGRALDAIGVNHDLEAL